MSKPPADELVREGWSRRRQPLPARRVLTEALVGGAFVVAAVCLAVLGDGEPELQPGTAIALIAMFALGIGVRIDVGVGYTSPVQLAFVPMLLLLPTSYVPLFVLVAWFIGLLPRFFGTDRDHPDRLLLVPADCWFAFGPALVLVLADAQTPAWEHWPVYLLALTAQFSVETVTSYVRERVGEGAQPEPVLKELGLIWAIDALLSPLGLLAAFASQTFDYAFVLLLPPAALLTFYARERTDRLRAALALADAARDREDLIAGASHELVTPLGVLVGLTDRLVAGNDMVPERRQELDVVMRREVLALRQIIRQFLDYTRLKTEHDLQLVPQPVAMEDVVREAARALPGAERIRVEAPPALPPAEADPGRAAQIVLAMLAEAGDGARSVHVHLAANDEQVVLAVGSPRPPRERPFAEGGEGSSGGLGLYVARELARRQGGELVVDAGADGGARYVLTLMRA